MENYLDDILGGVIEEIPAKFWYITLPLVLIVLGVLLY